MFFKLLRLRETQKAFRQPFLFSFFLVFRPVAVLDGLGKVFYYNSSFVTQDTQDTCDQCTIFIRDIGAQHLSSMRLAFDTYLKIVQYAMLVEQQFLNCVAVKSHLQLFTTTINIVRITYCYLHCVFIFTVRPAQRPPL